jgi:carboxypeptidase C (cathepsin A)
MNLSGVHDALHVNKKLSPKTWSECSDVLSYSSSDYRTNVIDLYQELIDMGKAGKHNLSMLVYSGDDDSVCPTPQTQSWISGLGISGKSSQTWVPWVVNQQTAGYVTVFDLGAGAHAKFSFVTVHGAGHEVPSFRPNEALVMFKNYLNRVW